MKIIIEPYSTYVDFNKYNCVYPTEKADGLGINKIRNYCICPGQADGNNVCEESTVSIEYLCLNIKIHMY